MSIVVSSFVEGALARAGLLGRGLLVALSGGLDSVCLVRLLRELGAPVEVAHLDHGLRDESGDDARFCERLAGELGVAFHLRRLRPGELEGRGGTQANARRVRRAFLERLCAERGLAAVALGHHADDQVETVLLRLLRGVGPRGVAGMAEWKPPYLRPLLGIRRSDLEECARARGWEHREDASNLDPKYRRNHLRHAVLPGLLRAVPGAEGAVARFARLAAQDDALLTELTRREFEAQANREPDGVRLSAERLRALPAPLRRRVYLAGCAEVGADPAVLGYEHLEAVDALLAPGRAHRRAAVPGPADYVRSYADLWILRPGAWSAPEVVVTLGGPGRVSLGEDTELVWSVDRPARGVAVALSAGRPAGALAARSWRPGDRVPAGREGTVKVKDVLMGARVPAWRRRRALILADEQGPLGVLCPGLATGAGQGGTGFVWVDGAWWRGG